MNQPNQKKWTVILNPHAGAGKGKRDIGKIMNLLSQKGFQYNLLVSNFAKHSISIAVNAIEIGCRNFIVVGGDGTLNEVANGIFRQQECSPEEITVGMIPIGTGNDWIKTFGIPNNYEKAIEKIVKGETLLQDIGIISYFNEGIEVSRYFSNMAGFGFDALVADKANQLKEKACSGLWVYLYSFIVAYFQYKTRRVEVSVDGKKLEEYVFSISVGIGKYNGGGMMQTPEAIPNDGTFEITIIKKIGIWTILKNLIGLYNGRFVKDSHVDCFQAKKVAISCSSPLDGEVDGESLGKGQFKIKIIPKKLKVIVGKKM